MCCPKDSGLIFQHHGTDSLTAEQAYSSESILAWNCAGWKVGFTLLIIQFFICCSKIIFRLTVNSHSSTIKCCLAALFCPWVYKYKPY